MFQGVHFNQDSKDSFSVNHNSRTQKMVHHENKLAIAPPPHPTPSLKLIQSSCLTVKGIGCGRTLSESYINVKSNLLDLTFASFYLFHRIL